MQDRNGVRIGQRVRDVDGKELGRVTDLYAWGFKVTRGFPILFRHDEVVRYDEVRGARDGALVVARSARDLLDHAAGEVPRSWRVPAPPGYPSAATPSEARLVLADIARGAAFSRPAADEPLVASPPETSPLTRDEEREYAELRGQGEVTAADSDAESTRSRSSSSTNPEDVFPRPSR